MIPNIARHLTCVIMFPLAAWAQQKPDPSAAAAAPSLKYRISGTIVDMNSGSPLAKTRVMIAPTTARTQIRTLITASDGRFSFDNLVPAKYSLGAERQGYPAQGVDMHETYSTAIVAGPDIDSEHLVFRLKPAGSISGRISDDFDEPQRNVSVMLFRSALLGGSRATAFVRTVQTDDLGAYHMLNLPTGKYFVAASGQVWFRKYAQQILLSEAPSDEPETAKAQARSPLDTAYPVTFYPEATDPQNAVPISVKFGQRVKADIRLHAVPSIHVRILAPGSRPIAKVFYRAFNATEAEVPIDTRYSGIEQLELSSLAPGKYILELTRDGAPSMRAEVDWTGDTATTVDELLARSSAAVVSGAIKFDGDLPPGSKPELLLGNIATRAVRRAAVKPEGTFSFSEPLPIGTYEVHMANSAEFWVWAIDASGAEANGTRLTISGPHSVQLSVVATRSVGTVDGLVQRDGKATAGSMIVLVPDNIRNVALYRRDQSDSDGTFTLPSVLPGAYTVIAVENWDLEWSNPEVVKKYLPAGEVVHVSGNDTHSVRVVAK